ncbi:MAG TPA: 3'-5' exonuclease, partial [Candidatus Wallbacteria bacterium]|nr:3'-5' exonuclease [Candidatus Wallbacteria bacterium]
GVPDYILFALCESFRENLTASGADSFSIYNALKSLCENKIDFSGSLNAANASGLTYENEKARLLDIFEKINTYIQLSESLDAYDLLSFIYMDLNLSARYCGGDFGPASANIEKLLAHIHENAFLPNGSVHDFLENFQSAVEINFSEEESQYDFSNGDAVKIMTIHQAKGLEEKIVFVPELEADFFRTAGADILVNSQQDIAFQPGAFVRLNERSVLKNYYEAVKKYERYQELFEKKRLLYVAMTRAQELLVLSGSFKITAGENGPGKSAKLEKMPFILSGSHLNWLVNFLGLDANFFVSALAEGEYRDLKTGYGNIRLFVKPPAAAPKEEKTAAPYADGSHAQLPSADFKIPSCVSAAEYLRPHPASNGPARITYSDYKIIASSGLQTLSGKTAQEKFNAGGLLKIGAADAPEALTGSAFHKAVEMIISSGAAVESFSKKLSGLAVKAYKSLLPLEYDPAIPAAVEKMLGNFFNNLNKTGLQDVFDCAKSETLKRFCELKMFYRSENFFLEGNCDLLTVNEAGEAVIYDFKTVGDASAAARRIEEYQSQLAFYQLCASSHFSDIKSFGEPSVILIENAGQYKVIPVRISLKAIEENQRLIIKNCGELFASERRNFNL